MGMRPPSSSPQEGGGAGLPRLQLQASASRQQVSVVLQCAMVQAMRVSCRRHHKGQNQVDPSLCGEHDVHAGLLGYKLYSSRDKESRILQKIERINQQIKVVPPPSHDALYSPAVLRAFTVHHPRRISADHKCG